MADLLVFTILSPSSVTLPILKIIMYFKVFKYVRPIIVRLTPGLQ